VIIADGVASKRIPTAGCVVGTSCVVPERKCPVGRVTVAGCVARKRIPTDGGVEKTGGKAEERITTHSSVVAGIASARCRKNRSSYWQKRKAGEYERDKN